jgi:hypothetical protein
LTGQGRRRVEPTSADMFLSQERGTVPLIGGGGRRGRGDTDYISHIFSLVPKSKKIRRLTGTLEAASKWYAVSDF